MEEPKYDADMPDETTIRYVEYLADELHKSNLERKAMRLVLEDFFAEVSELKNKLSEEKDLISKQNSMISEMKEQQAYIMVELRKSQCEAAELAIQLEDILNRGAKE